MRWSLRREPRGRHALGAAVTAIPTAPPRPTPVPVPLDAWSSWSAPGAPQPVPHAAVPPVPSAVPAPYVPPDPPVDAVTEPAPVTAPALPVLPVQPVDLEPSLLDLAGTLPSQPVQAPPPARTGPRVELGFADGTFRMLDPSSSAAQALSDLVGELTGKGERPSPSAS
jgi:hypothetical protein